MGISRREQERQIGDYTLYPDEKLGSGAYAIVYLGKVNQGNKYVAIKEFTDKNAFQHEAAIFEQLHNQLRDQTYRHHILSYICQIGYTPKPWIVVELARGGTLKEYIEFSEKKPMETEQAVKILKQIGDAVSFIHKQKILHCDITPQNILFDDYSHTNAILADFGIAVQDPPSKPLAKGDLLYMAPERFDGTATIRSDQYSLGCIAYELFTGSHPLGLIATLPDTDHAEMQKLHNETKRNPCKLNGTLPESVGEAVLRAIAIRPGDRFDDIDAFLQAIEGGFVNSSETSKEATVPAEKGVAETPQPIGASRQEMVPAEKDIAKTLLDLCLKDSFNEFKKALDKTIDYKVKEGTLVVGFSGRTRRYNYISKSKSGRILIYVPEKFLIDSDNPNLHLINLGLIMVLFKDFAHPDSDFFLANDNDKPQEQKTILLFSDVGVIGENINDEVIEYMTNLKKTSEWQVEFVPFKKVCILVEDLKEIDGNASQLEEIKKSQKNKKIEGLLKISSMKN